MAVVLIDIDELKKRTKKDEKRLCAVLESIGIPTELLAPNKLAVEVTPNRPDLLSIEGIIRAINCYTQKERREYRVSGDSRIKLSVESVSTRPYVVAAIARNVSLTEKSIEMFIDFQEKLHQTIGRKRKKIAIGFHDADRIYPPLTYRKGKRESFVPLESNEELGLKEILEQHEKGRMYSHLIQKHEYPIITDSKGAISFPPIINSERTKLTSSTENILIELTGTSLDAIEGVLRIICCALIDHGANIEKVNVGGIGYPNLFEKKMKFSIERAEALLGVKLGERTVKEALEKMGVGYKGGVAVIPPYRLDFIGEVDIFEDIAIGIGYEKFEPTYPNIPTIGKLGYDFEDVRDILVGMGFTEIKNFVLTNRELLEKCGLTEGCVEVQDPKSEEFSVVRTSLLPFMLSTFSINKTAGLPQKFFEVGSVVCKKEKMNIAFGIMDDNVGFNEGRAYLQTLLRETNIEYQLKITEHPLFSTATEILVKGKSVGVFGEVSDTVLKAFSIPYRIVLCEMREDGIIL